MGPLKFFINILYNCLLIFFFLPLNFCYVMMSFISFLLYYWLLILNKSLCSFKTWYNSNPNPISCFAPFRICIDLVLVKDSRCYKFNLIALYIYIYQVNRCIMYMVCTCIHGSAIVSIYLLITSRKIIMIQNLTNNSWSTSYLIQILYISI